MKLEWVQDMWTKSLSGFVNAADDEIVSQYKCPMFYKLIVTASLLGEKEKQRIKAIINENGESLEYSARIFCNNGNKTLKLRLQEECIPAIYR